MPSPLFLRFFLQESPFELVNCEELPRPLGHLTKSLTVQVQLQLFPPWSSSRAYQVCDLKQKVYHGIAV